MHIILISIYEMLLLIISVFVLGAFGTSLAGSVNPLENVIIIVDAGHGGIDPGANRPGVLEKDINLDVALLTKEILSDHGAKVVLSREADIDLSSECDNEKVRGRYRRDLHARLEAVEETGADLFISIHANAVSNPNKRGAECYYYGNADMSKALATTIQLELAQVTRGSLLPKPANFFVLKRNTIPAVLIEVGYITNAEEKLLLQSTDYQRKVAEAIVMGIYTFFLNYPVN